MPSSKGVKVHFTPSYLASYARLPAFIQRMQDEKEQLFRVNPFDPRIKTHKLKGRLQELWSYSVNRQYRVLFRFVSSSMVIFYDIGTHEVYQ